MAFLSNGSLDVSRKASGRDRMAPGDAPGIKDISEVVDIKCHQMPEKLSLNGTLTTYVFK